MEPDIVLYGQPFKENSRSIDAGFLGDKSSTFERPILSAVGGGTDDASDTLSFGNITARWTFSESQAEGTLMTGYGDESLGGMATWGFGFPTRDGGHESFLHKAAVNWTDKRMGLFLSRHRAGPGEESHSSNLPQWKDSEIMTGWVSKGKR